MAVAGVSAPGVIGNSLGFDDYSVYSNLSDDELMQLAIERSLADAEPSASTAENIKSPVIQTRSVPAVTRPAPSRRPAQPQPDPIACPANPPSDPSDLNPENIVSHFMTGSGKRMVRYRRYDGTVQVRPEKEEDLQPIVRAIANGDVRTVRELAKKADCNILQQNKLGWIPLHEAAYYGQDQCLKILLRGQPGMINKRTLKDQTALLLAVSRDNVACVQCLLENGADADIPNNEKETPLYKACERENSEIVAMLLNAGAMVNKHCIQGWTALHEAVSRDHVEIAQMLLKAGAKVSIANMFGITPIFVAAQSGKLAALRFLLKNGADINSQAGDGATALYEASKNGHVHIVEFLLSQKADANKPGKTGLLPIHIAAQRGNSGIVSMLIPATSRARVRRTGISPIHLAAERNRDEILEVLINADYDVNAMLSEDRSKMYEDRRSTALYFAVANSNVEVCDMLLRAGADPNLDTFNVLLVAARQGCIRTMKLLVEHGANINAYIPTHPTTFPATVLFCMKYLSMLKFLMDNGCDALSCFNCVYGSGPHPPLKTSHRDDMDRNHDSSPKTCVQFCEMVSTDAYSRWAGPIIDVLLDYVGDVKMCSRLTEHLDSYDDWANIKEKAMPPRPLMQLCRLKIRQSVGVSRLKRIHTLPVPGSLIRFLKHQEGEIEL